MSIIWELVRGGRVIARLEQDLEDYRVNGRGYVLADLIPEDHAIAAQSGEWHEYGFVYQVGNAVYLVRPRLEEDVHDCR